MQNNDTTKTDAFSNLMDNLFVKVKRHDVSEHDRTFAKFYDLDSDEYGYVDPKTDPNNRTVTENGATTFSSSGSNLVDFFYFTVEGISQQKIHKLLDASWREQPLKTLKVIFFIRDIRNGKGENEIFYETQRWLALNHPQTFLENLKNVPTSGYWKDLQNVLLYIRYGGHERDERPNWAKEKNVLLKRLPSEKSLYEKAIFQKRRSYRPIKTEEDRRIREKDIANQVKQSFSPNELWNQEVRNTEKLVLTKEESKKLKLVYEKAKDIVVDLYVDQLLKDRENLSKGEVKSLTLCAKWAPTINLSTDRQLGIGKQIAQKLFPFDQPDGIQLTIRKEGKGDKKYTDQQVYRYLANIKYQKLLRDLRKATVTIETFMSSKEWSNIPYERVPSVCMNKKKKLFSLKDNERFVSFLESVKKGEKKINGAVLFPHQLIEQLYASHSKEVSDTIELQWREIVKNVKEKSDNGIFNCIPVCDVSGSMNGTPLNVCVALGLLMSEINTGIFRNKIITFSENPSFVDLSGIEGVKERFDNLCKADWGMSTNYISTFKLILEMALKNNLPKDQMIKKVVVFSDMQFNESSADTTSHQEIVDMFAEHGYEAPGIIYWNLRGDVDNIPITVTTDNVACMSGFNAILLKMLMDMDLSIEGLVDASIKDYDFVTLHD
ncbi:predicted protein [Naegleria gruberi]|uniref:Predicted protein n=1 Tax=Naegleria gruberi TaxID=5762 RepID=D2VVP3_NAEGR|nr:uncharacterized protein NAEGRDRAFT_73090 [Naegleria gruberi]EFC39076.1 predicted protein [Naegleria gruberi]|eukprot:XP_002671820.1 predicted protein [Naegleria gruberi strain NEG-M]